MKTKGCGRIKNSTEEAFDLIEHEIDRLLDRLQAKNVCPCCVGLMLLYHGRNLYENATSSEEAAAMCRGIADEIFCADDIAMPVGSTQH